MSFLSTDCELSTNPCSKNVYNLGPWSSPAYININAFFRASSVMLWPANTLLVSLVIHFIQRIPLSYLPPNVGYEGSDWVMAWLVEIDVCSGRCRHCRLSFPIGTIFFLRYVHVDCISLEFHRCRWALLDLNPRHQMSCLTLFHCY